MEARARAAESFNADLKLLRHMTAHEPEGNWPKPKNIAQLATLLKYKNSPNQFRSEQVEKGRSWLRKRGIDIETIYNKIQRRAEQPTSEQPTDHQQDSYFYLNLSAATVPEYLEKSYEYGSMNLLQHAMSRETGRRKFIVRAVEDMVQADNSKRFKITWAGERVPDQREVYIRAVKSVVRKDKDRSHIIRELLNELKTGFYEYKDQSVWEILASQLEKHLANADPAENLTSIAIASLKLVEAEFQKRLHGQDLDRYLAVTYLHRIYGKSYEQKETVWGKMWLYMISGMHRQALELIGHRHKNYTELSNAYVKSYQSINSGRPVACRVEHRPDIKDIFYDQVVYCLNADSRFSNEVLCENYSLELVWLILRTTGIYEHEHSEKSQKFETLREGVVGSYRDCTSNPQLVKHMLYLLDYEAVLKMGPNVLMNQDDYLHFVIVMSAFPELAKLPHLEKLLVEKLTETIIELMVEKREEYIYYIALLPQQAVVSELSSIIVSSDAVDSIHWKQLRELLPSEVYISLVKATLARFVAIRGDYLKAAEKVTELIGDDAHVLDYLANMLIKHHMRIQAFPHEQVLKAEELGARLAHQKPGPFEKIFEVFANARQLGELLMGRNEGRLQEFIANNELIFLSSRALCGLIAVLEKLGEYGGIDVYFNFLRDAVKATEICTMRTRRTEELRNFKGLLLKNCERLLESEQLCGFGSEAGASGLLEYLRQTS